VGVGWMDGWMYTEHFEASSDVHTLNTRSKYHNRPTANLSYSQKSASYAGIKIFNSLPLSLSSVIYRKGYCTVALKRYLNTRSFYFLDNLLIFRDTHDPLRVFYTYVV